MDFRKNRFDLLAMIRIINLRKQYRRLAAVDNLNIEVAPGEIFGFLGPNGAGKTTTIRMMTGLLEPSGGRVLLGGHDLATEPEAAKALLGYVPDQPFVYDKLTAKEFLTFIGGLYRVDRDEIRERVRARDKYTCQVCGAVETNRQHDVHHKVPLRAFTSLAEANRLENLTTLCPSCHH